MGARPSVAAGGGRHSEGELSSGGGSELESEGGECDTSSEWSEDRGGWGEGVPEGEEGGEEVSLEGNRAGQGSVGDQAQLMGNREVQEEGVEEEQVVAGSPPPSPLQPLPSLSTPTAKDASVPPPLPPTCAAPSTDTHPHLTPPPCTHPSSVGRAQHPSPSPSAPPHALLSPPQPQPLAGLAAGGEGAASTGGGGSTQGAVEAPASAGLCGRRCWGCGSAGVALKKCTGCRWVWVGRWVGAGGGGRGACTVLLCSRLVTPPHTHTHTPPGYSFGQDLCNMHPHQHSSVRQWGGCAAPPRTLQPIQGISFPLHHNNTL